MPLREGSGSISIVHMGNCSPVRGVRKCPTHAGNTNSKKTGQLTSEAEILLFSARWAKRTMPQKLALNHLRLEN